MFRFILGRHNHDFNMFPRPLSRAVVDTSDGKRSCIRNVTVAPSKRLLYYTAPLRETRLSISSPRRLFSQASVRQEIPTDSYYYYAQSRYISTYAQTLSTIYGQSADTHKALQVNTKPIAEKKKNYRVRTDRDKTLCTRRYIDGKFYIIEHDVDLCWLVRTLQR